MDRVLSGLPTNVALVYIDDILVSGHSFQEHLTNLKTVFKRLQAARLKLAPNKCQLFRKEVKYLGHVVSDQGIATDPQKTEKVLSWPVPTCCSDVRSFLGLCSYYRRFVPSFANLAKPLHLLLEDGQHFSWTEEADAAFQELKRRLTQAPVLGYPLPDGKFILDTDASNYATGAVLSQVQDGQERVISYFSQSLSKAERQYCVTRKELVAIVKAVKQFHCYLYGRHFEIRTDHAALTWLLNFRNPEGQVARWLERLGEYDFRIEHRVGTKHLNADALSRRPCLLDNCNHCARLESRDNLHADNHKSCLLALSLPRTDMPASIAITSLVDLDKYEELRVAQLQDLDIQPVLQWKETDSSRPSREDVAKYSSTTKLNWAQWNSLKLDQGVLHRIWERLQETGQCPN